MSDKKLISPLLDGFMMGDPISEHNGVRCCPAMREDSDDKYIVKIISIPSSQRQLDALLLTGAYPDAASAMEYFNEQAAGVIREAEVLKNLSKLQGFLPYENWQVVPMGNNQLGYEVYLLSTYKHSLEKHLQSHTMTHLGAVNLGLDLCAALSICRRAGYMFVDLKPSNIFITGQREFRIGDLGFAQLDTLKFNSLPSKYCSPYTPTELHDPMSTLNPTADIYAVGMILYQIYNDGKLSFDTAAPASGLPSPLNADYELAEIIQKAIDPNPRKRWQTPIEMGQALVGYMQRNSITDAPIVPPVATEDLSEAISEDSPECSDEELQEEIHEELAFMQDLASDETVPNALDEDIQIDIITTKEVNSMLAQADELIAMELPDEVILPNIEDLSIPEIMPSLEPSLPTQFIKAKDSVEQEDSATPEDVPVQEDVAVQEESAPAVTEYSDDEDDIVLRKPSSKGKRRLITALILAALLGLGAWSGFRFYQDYYLVSIDRMEIKGKEDTISVYLNTQADETLFTVVCTDSYGNTLSMPLINGMSQFIGLNPDTTYMISVDVNGFHGLTGAEPCSYTTPAQTKISNFTGKTGTEDGSVILSFTVDGRDAQDWTVEYSAEGEETRSVSFTGHNVIISELTVDTTYTFTLIDPVGELWMVGNPTLEYTAAKIVVAEKLSIVSCVDGVLIAKWTAPEGSNVESWTVRCYSDGGYDETITTTETTTEFKDIEPDKAYTVEVTAAGMTQFNRTYVTANSATVTKIHVDAPSDEYVLNVDWEFSGIEPAGGWLLMYSIDGSDNQAVVPCTGTSAVISPRIPGVTYNFSIQASDGSTVFNGKTSYDSVESDKLNEHGIDSRNVSASLCPTPKKKNWTYKDIGKNDYTSKYAPGSKVSVVIYSSERAKSSDDIYEVMFVIRDSEGNVLADLVKTTSATWNELWNNRTRYCSLDLPAIPGVPGKYTVQIYFNSHLLVEKSLTITE